MSFDSLFEPDLYVDVDDVIGWVMIPIDKKELWTMNLPLEIRILWAMRAQSMRYKLVLGFKEIYPKNQ